MPDVALFVAYLALIAGITFVTYAVLARRAEVDET